MRTLRNFRLVRVITLMATLSLIWLQIGPVLAAQCVSPGLTGKRRRCAWKRRAGRRVLPPA